MSELSVQELQHLYEGAIYVSGDDFYLWIGGKLKPIGNLSAEWHGQTLALGGIPVDSSVTVLAREQ